MIRVMLMMILSASVFISCQNTTEENVALKRVKNPEQKLQEWWQMVKAKKLLVKDGDLITRSGSDVISNSLRNFNKKDKSYSHSGIVFIEQGEMFVYHTLSGDENPTDKMMREPFDSFCNPYKKTGIGIFRYDIDEAERSRLQALLKNYYKKEMRFDKIFDLKDDSKMYCAEIIMKCLKKCTDDRVILPTTIVRNFRPKDPAFNNKILKEFEYIAVDNLYLNSNCKEIARVKFD